MPRQRGVPLLRGVRRRSAPPVQHRLRHVPARQGGAALAEPRPGRSIRGGTPDRGDHRMAGRRTASRRRSTTRRSRPWGWTGSTSPCRWRRATLPAGPRRAGGAGVRGRERHDAPQDRGGDALADDLVRGRAPPGGRQHARGRGGALARPQHRRARGSTGSCGRTRGSTPPGDRRCSSAPVARREPWPWRWRASGVADLTVAVRDPAAADGLVRGARRVSTTAVARGARSTERRRIRGRIWSSTPRPRGRGRGGRFPLPPPGPAARSWSTCCTGAHRRPCSSRRERAGAAGVRRVSGCSCTRRRCRSSCGPGGRAAARRHVGGGARGARPNGLRSPIAALRGFKHPHRVRRCLP